MLDTLKMDNFMSCAESAFCEVKSLGGRVVAVAAGAAGADLRIWRLWCLEAGQIMM